MLNLLKIFIINLFLILNVIQLKSQIFEDIALKVGINHFAFDPMIMSSGIAVFDYNNDGFEDIYMVSGVPLDHLYKNNGDGTYSNVTVEAGFGFTKNNRICGVATGDINNDGYRDMILATGGNTPDILMLNNKNGTFTDISRSAGINFNTYAYTATFVDFDQDGFLDIYIGNYGPSPGEPGMPNVLYRNNGDLTFTNVTEFHGVGDIGCALAFMFTDIDNDNDLDLLLINDIGLVYQPNKVFEYDQDEKRFKDISLSTGFNTPIYGMGIANLDINEDGYFDHYVTNIRHNLFYVNQKNKTFIDRARSYNMTFPFIPDTLNPDYKYNLETTSWGALFMDYDGDTYDDLFVTKGHVQTPEKYKDPDKALKNIENKTFVDVSDSLGFNYSLRSRGLAQFDYDNDGDMDLLVNVVDIVGKTDIKSKLYKNNIKNNTNWLKIKLVGSTINRDAFGSRVKVYFADRMKMQQVDAGGGTYSSQSSSFMHWGLAGNTEVDSIVVDWLGGDKKVLKKVGTNQTLTIIQDYKVNVNIEICKGEFFEGKIINEPQIITKTRTAYNGADSIITYNITVKNPMITSSNLELCVGEEYNGVVIYEDVIVEEKNIGFNGCDSTNFVSIKVLPTQTSEETINLCYGDKFNGKNYFSSTKLSNNFPSSQGCDSIHIVNLNVLKENKQTIQVYLDADRKYNGKFYPSDTTIIEVFTDMNGCDSTITTTLVAGLSIGDDNSILQDILVFPNPLTLNSEILNIELNSKINSLCEISLFDLNGNVIFNKLNYVLNEGHNSLKLDKISDKNSLKLANNQTLYIRFTIGNRIIIKNLLLNN
ncbi:MAG: FG-GAP-like repeat-containing protein [Candidatus Kapaibacteriota bacterium]|jgi:hypothetical protein